MTLSVSFNGKTRFTLDFPATATREEIEKAALADEQAQKYLEGMQVVKVIVVPGKIVNIVLKNNNAARKGAGFGKGRSSLLFCVEKQQET